MIVLLRTFDTPLIKFADTISNPAIKTHPFKIRKLQIIAEIARTPTEQQRGLSGRRQLPELAGMLFIFEQDGRPGFWMKDMYFPIDIIWIDRQLRLAAITSNVAPETFPQIFTPPRDIRYVLEINAGLASAFNLRPGDSLIP